MSTIGLTGAMMSIRVSYFFRICSLVLFVFLFQTSGPASAQTTTLPESLIVQITIEASCIIVTTSTVDFETVGVIDTDIDDVTGSITVQCTDGTTYDVAINEGAGDGATVTDRKMTETGGATIDYSLYRDPARSNNWGDTVGVDTEPGTGNGDAQVITVYGLVEAQTTPVSGDYTDTVQVTVTY